MFHPVLIGKPAIRTSLPCPIVVLLCIEYLTLFEERTFYI